LLAIALIILIFALLIFIGALTKVEKCPSTLPEEYYECNVDNDCLFNPIFECINRNMDYYCIADEELVASRQAISDKFSCKCENGKCKTIIST